MLRLQGVLGVLLPLMAAGLSLPPLPFIGKPGPAGCGMFEEFRRCGPPCPPTCDTLRETVCCEVACVAGCFCADGYILEKDPTTGPRKCIPLNQCPSPGVLSFERPTISVLEGSGKAVITVVRLNGSYSPVSVRYKVVDPAGPYAGLVGELEFPDGVVSRTIEIPLQDNAVRNPDFTIRLELFEPSRKTYIVAGTFVLTILDDDMTPGYLDLEKTHFNVPENVGSVRVQVLRHEGSDGQLRVKYRTVPDSASSNVDFSPTTGELVFEEGETSKVVTVSIVDDEVRETPEKFRIELFDFTHGPGVLNFRRRGSVLTADVTIVDNDMRPGILQLERPSYSILENSGTVDVTVVRLDGQDGQIKVRFEARPKTAKSGHDFELQTGELVFEEGELRKTIRIKIVDDNVREPEENFEVALFDATPGPGTINFRGIEQTRKTTTITIIDDDMNPGVLQLDRSTYEVMEDAGSVRVDVVRSGGQDGRLTVQYQTKGLTANENVDFVPTSGELIFEEGETRKSIEVQIKDDVEKEPLETLQVQLFNPSHGPGIIHFRGFGTIEKAIIKIRDNDMTPGILQFERSSYEVWENVGTLKIAVVRLDGSDGQLRVKYRTVATKAVVHQDFKYTEGELVFGEGETRKDIIVEIVDDDVREPVKAFQVELLDASYGPGVINFRGLGPITATVVTINDDDMKPGILQLEKPSYEVYERAGTVTMGVIRLDGTDGEIRVKYRTVAKTAQANQDFVYSEGELVFGEGVNRRDINIKIVDNDVREPTKTFEVQLLDATPGVGVINFRRFTANPTAVVAILDDDMKPGTFQIERPSYDIYENVGTITIGVIRLDGTDGELRVKYTTIPKTAQVHQDFVPVEGELVFGEKENRKEIVIKIVDDDVRETTKTFEVQLLDITPGVGVINFRRFTSNPTTTITIRDDDMRPGTFQIERPSYDIFENVGTITIAVIRLDGTDGEMRVKYRTVPKTAQVHQDFIPIEGELMFGEKETRKDIVIKIVDDDVREATKTFEVQLVDITPGVGVINFRRLTSIPTAIVTLRDDDMRPGTFQIERPSYDIFENVGTITMGVIRLDGTDGEMRVKYRTVPKTAQVHQDFVPAEGELIFGEKENRKDIVIKIVDDDVREATKTFEVQLVDITPGVGVINFRRLTSIPTAIVTIRDDDMKPGIIQLEEAVYQFFENVGTVQIPVVRVGGSDGQIRAFYRATPKTALLGTDFVFVSGELVFKEGEIRKFIEIEIVNDNVREETKSFEVELLNPQTTLEVVNFIGLGQIPKAEVYILDDDMSPGFLDIEQSSYVVPENAGQVQISVIRLGGKDGRIKVKYRTVARSAAAQTDFLPVEGELIFEDGEDRKFILVRILNDNVREAAEMFEVQLFEPMADPGIINFRGTGSKPSTVITIQDDDTTPGILELDRPTYFVNENVGIVQIVVVRRGGTDGQIRCQYQTRPKSAVPGTDFAPVQGELVFEDGESSKVIQVQIVDDRVREPRESFEIVLMEPNQGLERVLGQTQTTEVVITDDDMTPGFLELEETSYVVSENVGTLTVVVRRVEGSDGQIRVGYVTTPKTALQGFDFTPIKGELVFEDGETRKTIQIHIRDDNQKEPTENFEIQLVEPATGLNFRNLGQKQKALVTINDDDWTLGSFEFQQVSYTVLENAGSVTVEVIRLGGSDGQVRVRYQTVPKSAQPSSDFEPLSGELVFEDGETKKTILVPILNDGVREPTETFEIQLLDATPPQGFVNFRGLGQKRTAVVTIFDDDGNPGFLELEEPTYVVSEGIRTLQVVVNRRGGSDGRIQCRYQTTARSALAGIDFEPGSGELVFEDGETQKTISIQIVNDKIKEAIKSFEVQLLDPLPAPGIFNFRVVGARMKTLVSIADDDTKPGLVQLEIPSFTVKESVGTVNIPVIRVNGSDGQIRVRYQAVPGTAREGADFAPLSGDLVFEDGESRKVVRVQILDDRTKEATESFELRLVDASPGPGVLNFDGLGFIQNAVVTILDDDMNHGFLELESPSYHFSEGSGTASIGVVRLEGTDGRIRVRYQTSPKTAIPGTDYVDTSGELVFEDGMKRKDISVQILNDRRKEVTKTFEVQLFEPRIEGEDVTFRRGLGSRSISLVSIWDDDHSPGVFQFRETQVSVREGSARLPLTIVRTDGTDGSVSLRLRTVDGSARLGEDYTLRTSVISFSDGEREKTVDVDIIDDNIREGAEHFKIGLFDPSNGALLGQNSIFAVTILDDDGFPERPSIPASRGTQIFFTENSVTVPRGSPVAKFKIRREGEDWIPLKVLLETLDGTARAGVDYRKTLGEVPFQPNEIELTVTLRVINNPNRVGTKSFQVRISKPSSGVVVRGRDLLTIFLEGSDAPSTFHQQFETLGRRAGSISQAGLSSGAGVQLPPNLPLPSANLNIPGSLPPVSLPALPSENLNIQGTLSGLPIPALPSSGLPLPQLPNLPSPGSTGQSSLPAFPPPPQGQRHRIPQGQKDCPPGLIFNPCFVGCPQVCNLVADPVCNRGCTPTCVCPKGLILESLKSFKCVQPTQCPRTGGSGGGLLGGGSKGGLLGGGGSGGGLLGGGGGGGLLGGGSGGGLLGGGGSGGGLLGGGSSGGGLLGGGGSGGGLLGGGSGGGLVAGLVGGGGGGKGGGLLGGGGGAGLLGGGMSSGGGAVNVGRTISTSAGGKAGGGLLSLLG